MRCNNLRPIPATKLTTLHTKNNDSYLWKNLFIPGDIALLTSQWKVGKTTLIHGLLRAVQTGTPFLERPTKFARTWVVSEESIQVWSERQQRNPLDDSVQLLCRPFRSRPSFAEWNELIEQSCEARKAGTLDLLVIDPLASFLPGHCESDAATLLDALTPLHQFTDTGGTILLLHHPKKNSTREGSLARGSGALLGFVDVSMELVRYGGLKSDDRCRRLTVQSRHDDTPALITYEWDPVTLDFAVVTDRRKAQFEANLKVLLEQFAGRKGSVTVAELRKQWTAEHAVPSFTTLYGWAQAACEHGLLRRTGNGTSRSPWAFRLPNKNDEDADHGELPRLDLLS